MPLFNKKLDFKPIPPRLGRCNIGCAAANEDIDDFHLISIHLSNKELSFADGIWIFTTNTGDVDNVLRLKQRYKVLEDQNNLCNLKIEVMLDLLAEYVSELKILRHKEN